MERDLDGLVALVTGGASGIGKACVAELACRGALVAVADRDLGASEAVAEPLGARGRAIEVDVTDEAAVTAMVRSVVGSFGKLDIAVNSAGVASGTKKHLADLDMDLWRRVTSVNLEGVFLSMRSEIRAMLRNGGGSIVNIASVMGEVAQPGSGAYIAAKHGVVGLTRAGAVEYADRGIRVNAVGPAFIVTPLLDDKPASTIDALVSRHPAGRLGTSAEVASVVGFLASPSASFVTGSFYAADGGYTAQ